MLELSLQGQEIEDFVFYRNESLIVSATAGSGKTTTLIHAAIPACIRKGVREDEILALMYSKPAQVDFAKKVAEAGFSRVKVSTYHALGNGLLVQNGSRMEKDKLRKIGEKYGVRNWDIYRLIKLAKSFGAGIVNDNSREIWEELNQIHSLDLIEDEISLAMSIFDKSHEITEVYDYDDMLTLPLLLGLKSKSYRVILNDESQDNSALRNEFLSRVCGNQRLIAVGDRRQCIFPFAGADAKSMDILKEKFKCEELPLSITYRCSQNVTKFARQWDSTMQFRPGAPLGRVQEIEQYDFNPAALTPDSAVLCRTNAPLVSLLFQLVGMKKKAFIQGREIADEIVNFSKKWKWRDFDELREKANRHLSKMASKMLPESKRAFKVIQDRVQILFLILDKCEEVRRTDAEDIKNIAELMFTDNGEGICLCTVHKSKGLGWNNVYIYGWNLMPAPWSKEWEAETEENIRFVAVTRAINNLTLINFKKKKED